MTGLTKLWLFLLTLCGGLLVLALLVLLPELGRVRREDQAAGMQLAQRTATLLLAEQAQHLVAAATQLASDAVLQTSLEEMGRGQAELAVLHSTAQMELQRQSRDKALRAAFLLATDARGRVLARVGQDEAVYRDALDGWPLVSDALRGYRLDDLWLWQGTLYRVAAAPVVAPARDRYVGAVLVAQVVGNELAQALARVSGLDAVFLCAGEVVGASLPRERIAVPELLALRAAGATPPGGAGPGAVAAVAAAPAFLPGRGEPVAFVELPGTAANQGAVLILIGRSMVGTSAWEVARGAAARGLPPRLLGILVAAVAVVLAIGLLLLRHEVEAPLARLLAALQEVESRPPGRGRAPSASTPVTDPLPLAEAGFSGPLRQLVRTLQAVLRPEAGTPAAPLSTPALASMTASPAAPPPAQGAPASLSAEPPHPSAAAAPTSPAPADATPRPPAAAAPTSPPPAAAAAPTSLPPAAAAAPTSPPPSAASTRPPAAQLPAALPSPILLTPPAVPVASAAASGAGDSGAVPTAVSTHIHTEETRVAGGASNDDLQAAYYRIYQEFVLARERCQESVEGLNFELFQQRLQQSREQIIHQHSCQAVQFHVHIKDGRATLRATPIWT